MTSGGEGTTPSEELKDKFRNVGERNGMFGKQHSADTRQKISDFRKQFRHSDETKQRMAQVRQTGDNPHNERWIVHYPDGSELCADFFERIMCG